VLFFSFLVQYVILVDFGAWIFYDFLANRIREAEIKRINADSDPKHWIFAFDHFYQCSIFAICWYVNCYLLLCLSIMYSYLHLGLMLYLHLKCKIEGLLSVSYCAQLGIPPQFRETFRLKISDVSNQETVIYFTLFYYY